jgi:hypothetical protein
MPLNQLFVPVKPQRDSSCPQVWVNICMITLSKIRIYESFKGDIDAWTCASRDKNDESMNGDDFYEISQLLQKIHLLKNSLVSNAFADEITREIAAKSENQATIAKLMQTSS